MRSGILVFVLLLITASVFARPVDKPFLYEITKDGKHSYLLGTVHAGVAWNDLPLFVHEKFEQAELFTMETNQGAMDPAIVAKFQYYPEGDSLRNHISAEAWDALVKRLPSIPPATLERLRPMVLSSILIQTPAPSEEKSTIPGLDFELQVAAQESGKTLSYLESWVHQLEVLDQLTTAQDIEDTVLSPPLPSGQAPVDSIVDLYIDGDLQALCNRAISDDAEINELLMFERNRNWIPVIDMMHYNFSNSFIAVGAGHFCGDEGLFELLEARGYTVKRVIE